MIDQIERIEQLQRTISHARRAEAKAGLWKAGMNLELAERWLAAWGNASTVASGDAGDDFWDVGCRWIQLAWSAGQQPPAIEE